MLEDDIFTFSVFYKIRSKDLYSNENDSKAIVEIDNHINELKNNCDYYCNLYPPAQFPHICKYIESLPSLNPLIIMKVTAYLGSYNCMVNQYIWNGLLFIDHQPIFADIFMAKLNQKEK